MTSHLLAAAGWIAGWLARAETQIEKVLGLNPDHALLALGLGILGLAVWVVRTTPRRWK